MHNKTKHQKQKGTHSEREATLRKKDEVPTGRNEGKQQKESKTTTTEDIQNVICTSTNRNKG